jgi:opacity protein-like surface antigen
MSIVQPRDSVHLKYQFCGPLAGLVAAALLFSPAAAAQATPGWYVGAMAGGSDLDKPKQTIANAPTPGATLAVVNDVDFGWTGHLALGRGFGPVRLEAEVGRTENKSGAYSAVSPIQATLPQKGHTDATRFMANGYYDLPISGLPFGLYLGAGAGVAKVTVKTFAAPARAPMAPPSQLLDYHDSRFAYQLMAGLSRSLGENLTVDLQYRWFDAGTARGRDARGERATRQVQGHNFEAGLRYAF